MRRIERAQVEVDNWENIGRRIWYSNDDDVSYWVIVGENETSIIMEHFTLENKHNGDEFAKFNSLFVVFELTNSRLSQHWAPNGVLFCSSMSK